MVTSSSSHLGPSGQGRAEARINWASATLVVAAAPGGLGGFASPGPERASLSMAIQL